MGEPSQFLLGSVITVFTWISRYITWISKQYLHFYHFIPSIGSWCVIINFSINTLWQNPLSRKVTFSSTQKHSFTAVFNLQVSDWVHCSEETGAHTGKSHLISKLIYFFLQIFKVVILPKNNTLISKNL